MKKSTYLAGYYLYKGDAIRLETVTPALLETAYRLMQTVPTCGKVRHVAYYHLDETLFLPRGIKSK
ncbi:MAG: hypothetical protein R2795_08540 [Saprospiraceae bacterium]